VEQGLAGPGVADGAGEDREHDAVLWIVLLDQHLVAPDAHFRRQLVELRLSHQRVDEEPVHRLQRTLLDVLVSAVHRLMALEADDGLPAELSEPRA